MPDDRLRFHKRIDWCEDCKSPIPWWRLSGKREPDRSSWGLRTYIGHRFYRCHECAARIVNRGRRWIQ